MNWLILVEIFLFRQTEGFVFVEEEADLIFLPLSLKRPRVLIAQKSFFFLLTTVCDNLGTTRDQRGT